MYSGFVKKNKSESGVVIINQNYIQNIFYLDYVNDRNTNPNVHRWRNSAGKRFQRLMKDSKFDTLETLQRLIEIYPVTSTSGSGNDDKMVRGFSARQKIFQWIFFIRKGSSPSETVCYVASMSYSSNIRWAERIGFANNR